LQKIQQIALDLTNACSKNCWFCYNHSHLGGDTLWKPEEVICFALDCFENGVEAFSLGGGEPFEYSGLFEIIDGIKDKLYTTVTSNGLNLEHQSFFDDFVKHLPDKIHISIHCPEQQEEVDRVIRMVRKLEDYPVKSGVNLLVSTKNLEESKKVLCQLEEEGIGRDRIILLPMKYQFSPTAEQMRDTAGGIPFQSPSCLLGCRRPAHYCSVTWNKKVSPCSYSPSKTDLMDLSFAGLMDALSRIEFQKC
jgi:MoaA/NifB/PqqE/SkfB family radical SAM enzyme